MVQPLRVGLVGVGAVGRMHLEAYRSLGDVSIVAVVDPDGTQLEKARALSDAACYPSLESALKRESLDIACILTPAASHEPATLECAAAGVHVLCEKPMALSVEACERMVAACHGRGVKLCYGASYRYLPSIVRAREMVLAGDLGDVLLVREEAIGGRGVEQRDTLSFDHYPRGGPGGSGMGLVDHGVHLIDVFGWMLDSRVKRAVGRGNVSGSTQRPEFAVLEYQGGALGLLVYEDGTFPTELPYEGIFTSGSGWSLEGPIEAGAWGMQLGCIHVHGTRGALRIFHYANALFHRNARGIRQIPLEDRPAPQHFALQLKAFAEAVRTGSEVPVPGEAGLEACRTLFGIYANAF